MAKQSGGKPQIDEDFMKEIISQGLPVKKQETPTMTVKTEIETPDKTDDKMASPETVDKQVTVKEEKAAKEPARRKKTLRAITGKPIHAGGLDRPPAVICQPYYPRKANEDSNRYRRTQGDRKQLCRKYPAPAFRPVSGRDKRTVRKQI